MLNWKIIITSIVLLWFFFLFVFFTFTTNQAKHGQIQTKILRFCESFDAIFIFMLFKWFTRPVGGACFPGERSRDRLLTGGRLLLGLHVFPSSAHYFYTPLLPDFFYSCRCCRRVDVQNHIMSKFTETAPRHRETCTFNGLTFITSPLLGHK